MSLINNAPAPTLRLLHRLRPLLASAIAFQFGARAGTHQGARWEDLDSSVAALTFRYRAQKGKAQNLRFKVLSLPALPRSLQGSLATLLRYWKASKVELCATFEVTELATKGCRLWELPFEDMFGAPPRWTSDTSSEWLSHALSAVGASPPTGFSFTSHSLRHGMASAAAAANVPFHKIRYLAGWAEGSTTINGYVDPTVRNSVAGRAFFEWLL